MSRGRASHPATSLSTSSTRSSNVTVISFLLQGRARRQKYAGGRPCQRKGGWLWGDGEGSGQRAAATQPPSVGTSMFIPRSRILYEKKMMETRGKHSGATAQSCHSRGRVERTPLLFRRDERGALAPGRRHVDHPQEHAAARAEPEEERERHVRVPARGVDDRAAHERAHERGRLADDAEQREEQEPAARQPRPSGGGGAAGRTSAPSARPPRSSSGCTRTTGTRAGHSTPGTPRSPIRS
jgi:hypothetical protein